MYIIYDLECNTMKNPIGIGDVSPVFSWKTRSDASNVWQEAYAIMVWDSQKNSVWNTGKILSEKTTGVHYNGFPLQSGENYIWQVISVNNKGEKIFSEYQKFMTGLLDLSTLKAEWIEDGKDRKASTETTEMWKVFAGLVKSRPDPETILDQPTYYRREFTITSDVKKAVIYATAKGIYELAIDGAVISGVLVPGYSEYKSYQEVQTFDVSELLTEGKHVITVILADGWYTGKIGLAGIGYQYGATNAFLMQLDITYQNGEAEQIVSDEKFSWTTGPYDYADLFIGECFNEHRLLEDFEQPDYKDTIKLHPVLVKPVDKSILKGLEAEPIKILEVINPEIILTPSGELVIDTGINIAGFVKIIFEASENTILTMTHSEVLDKEGNFLMNIMGQNKNQADIYICAKDGIHSYCPKFTFHGFRYVKLEGITKEQVKDAEICVIGSNLSVTGAFYCSNKMLNQLQYNIFRSQQANMISIPTDCPQRERAGWTGDMQVYTPTACFNMDVRAFLNRWLAFMRAEQLPDGQIPNVVPNLDSNKYIAHSKDEHISSAGWADACVIVPYVLYQKYGDSDVLARNYEMMKKWLGYVERSASTKFPKPFDAYSMEEQARQIYLWNTDFHFGDWLFPSASVKGMANPIETALATKEYVATQMYAYATSLMAKICEILGKVEEADKHRTLNSHIKQAFVEEYFDEDGRLPIQLQGIYVLALQMDLVPEGKKERVVKHLVELIHGNGDCLDTGFLSVPFLLDVLYENGQKELAYKLLKQENSPSWLYEIKQGATTIWESWTAICTDGTRTNVSYNHFSFGCVGDFMYRHILGLISLEPGYKKVMIAPDMACNLTHAGGHYESVYGKISVFWERVGGEVFLDVTLPPHVTGIICCEGLQEEISSGSYHFKTKIAVV